MDAEKLCPLCGEGHISAQIEEVETDYKGHKTLLSQHYLLCDHCGSDFAGALESKLNKRILIAWRKEIDGLLTGDEVAAIREQYHLTQAQASKLFGGGPVAFSKYENNDVSQSEAMDTLLRLIRKSPVAFRVLAEEKGLIDELVVPSSEDHMLRMSNVFSIERRPEMSSPHYAPKEFRKYEQLGEKLCK